MSLINKVNIIMPFSREEYKEELIEMLEPLDITLNIIEEFSTEWKYKDWIKSYSCWYLPFEWDPPYYKVNWFIQNRIIQDEEYYMFMGDDNLIDSKLINAIKECNTDLVFFSSYYNPYITLKLDLNNLDNSIKINNCSWYQIALKGKVLKDIVFHNLYYADGIMMETLYKNKSLTRTYLPNEYVKFNGLNKKWWNFS